MRAHDNVCYRAFIETQSRFSLRRRKSRRQVDLEDASIAGEEVGKVDEVVLAEPALVGDRDRARRVGERVLVEHARARHREMLVAFTPPRRRRDLRGVNETSK